MGTELAGMNGGLAQVAYTGDFNLRPWEVGYSKGGIWLGYGEKNVTMGVNVLIVSFYNRPCF